MADLSRPRADTSLRTNGRPRERPRPPLTSFNIIVNHNFINMEGSKPQEIAIDPDIVVSNPKVSPTESSESETDDKILLGRLASGDEKALGEIIKKYDRLIRGFVAQRNVLDANISDVTQEIWLSFNNAIKKGNIDPSKTNSSMIPLLKRMADTKAIDYLRSNRGTTEKRDPGTGKRIRSIRPRKLSLEQREDLELFSDNKPADQMIYDAQMWEIMQKVVAGDPDVGVSLSERERKILGMKLEGAGVKEIAQSLNPPVDQSRISQIMKSITEKLTKKFS